MNEIKVVQVPQADIDRLEKARLYLYEITEGKPIQHLLPCGVTDIMWKITHRKYPDAV